MIDLAIPIIWKEVTEMSNPRDFEEEVAKLRDKMNQILSDSARVIEQPKPLDGVEWIPVVEEMENEKRYTMDVTGLDDASYLVTIKVADMQPGEDYRETEELFPKRMVVNNINDPPVIELIETPQVDVEYSGEIFLNWTGYDADGDNILYTL